MVLSSLSMTRKLSPVPVLWASWTREMWVGRESLLCPHKFEPIAELAPVMQACELQTEREQVLTKFIVNIVGGLTYIATGMATNLPTDNEP